MTYEIEFKPKSIKDGRKIPKPELENIVDKIEWKNHSLQDNP